LFDIEIYYGSFCTFSYFNPCEQATRIEAVEVSASESFADIFSSDTSVSGSSLDISGSEVLSDISGSEDLCAILHSLSGG
jgi:hypothetical protein